MTLVLQLSIRFESNNRLSMCCRVYLELSSIICLETNMMRVILTKVLNFGAIHKGAVLVLSRESEILTASRHLIFNRVA